MKKLLSVLLSLTPALSRVVRRDGQRVFCRAVRKRAEREPGSTGGALRSGCRRSAGQRRPRGLVV